MSLALPDGLTRVALRIYRRLPVRARRRVVRTMSPNFTVGAMCFIERSDGALLLVQHTYRHRWGVPGGLLEKGEDPRAAARREVFEETGIRIELVGEPAVVVDPDPQRVDLVFRAQPVPGTPLEPVASSPEIRTVRWFPAGELPELQAETAQAMVTLARSSHSPSARPLAGTHRPVEPFAS
jgi:8-oxo-dGTP pyrophosphatase MutT (NUDIX family)